MICVRIANRTANLMSTFFDFKSHKHISSTWMQHVLLQLVNILTSQQLNFSQLRLSKFVKFVEFSEKIFVITVQGLEPAISCVRDQDATSVSARHIWETGSLNWTQFMFQWFIRFPEFAEFAEFNETSAQFRKKLHWYFYCLIFWRLWAIRFCNHRSWPVVLLSSCSCWSDWKYSLFSGMSWFLTGYI